MHPVASEKDLAERYDRFARLQAHELSPQYEDWARGVARDDRVLSLIGELPAGKRQPNLVFSSARVAGVPDCSYKDAGEFFVELWDDIARIVMTHASQTNEAARCALLLPTLAGIQAPISLIELGSAAGLCLIPDAYSYRYSGHAQLDPATGPSRLVIDCEVRGEVPVPVPKRMPVIASRVGIDVAPLDVRDPEHTTWLEALIWPEHNRRRARLREALDIARRRGVHVQRGDLLDDLRALVAQVPANEKPVVFHVATLAYLGTEDRARFARAIANLGVRWVAIEGVHVVPGVRERLDERGVDWCAHRGHLVVSVDGEPVAFAHPHGRWIEWIGVPGRERFEHEVQL